VSKRLKVVVVGQLVLALLVYCYSEGICHSGAEETRLYTNPEAFPASGFEELLAAVEKTSVWQPSAGPVGAGFGDLDHGLDDVLRVGEYPAVDTCEDADDKPLEKGQVRVLRRHHFFLHKLIGSELSCIGEDFSESSGEGALEQASDTLGSHDLFGAL
jgi:hypothetical protein